jgi:cyclopropane-fatty-acyl-phospholipid synthase
MWQKSICRWAERIAVGHLTMRFPDGQERRFLGDERGPTATIQLNNSQPVRRLLSGGALGFSRAYLDGDWETPDLGAVLELVAANDQVWRPVTLAGPLRAAIAFLQHRLRRNSRAGSRRNIAFHYDLGNEFYRLWLDETMTYSSALYTQPDMTLADAQREKYRRILTALNIGPDDHVLEIGCGWGGFAEIAIRETGCRVTGLTLSREQATFARERLQREGLADRADIRLQDYRDCSGSFDKIVSIEMFEAVGEENWPTYFERVRALLAPGGEALVQTITIAEDRFAAYRRNADFIQTYIFPGGMLPSFTAFQEQAATAELAVEDEFRFGQDYARTLLAWDRDFRANWSAVAKLGFDQRFFRMWHYYLHYCAVGFRTGRIDVVQFKLSKL